MRLKPTALVLALAAVLTGCSASWIGEPSPTTANLINDLKLEGFKCKGGFSKIECRQIEAYVEKAPKICTSEGGCTKQPCHDVRLVYVIDQAPNGIPGITQTTERTITRSIPDTKLYPPARQAELKEYCAVR